MVYVTQKTMADTNVPDWSVPSPTSAEASIHQTVVTIRNGFYRKVSSPVVTVARLHSALAFGSTTEEEENKEARHEIYLNWTFISVIIVINFSLRRKKSRRYLEEKKREKMLHYSRRPFISDRSCETFILARLASYILYCNRNTC